MQVKSELRWVGGKRKILNKLPIDSSKSTYIEPFVGGGSVLINVLRNYNFRKYVVSDLNKDLISFYKCLKDQPQELIAEHKKLENGEHDKEKYLNFRREFNEIEEYNIHKAALFLYLNKHGFNGLYRVNKKGELNTAFGVKKYKTDYDNLFVLSKLFSNVSFFCQNYEETLKLADNTSFIYLDPPYLNTFKGYTKDNVFSESMLLKELKEVDKKRATFTLSNSNDEYFYKNFSMFNIKEIESAVLIDGGHRHNTELVITNWKSDK